MPITPLQSFDFKHNYRIAIWCQRMESGFVCGWFPLQILTPQLSALEKRNCRRDATSPNCDATVVDNNTWKNRNAPILPACGHAGSIQSIDGGERLGARSRTLRRKYCTRTASQNGNPFSLMPNPAWIKFRFRALPVSKNVRSVLDETLWKPTKRASEVRQVFGILSS